MKELQAWVRAQKPYDLITFRELNEIIERLPGEGLAPVPRS